MRKHFLPGGDHETWRAADDGAAQAFVANEEIAAAFPDFLTCLATFSPAGFNETVKRESISFNWVITLINDTFGLKTKGEHFLALDDLKFDFSGGFTYMQAFMQVKDFICSGLLEAGSRFEGKQMTDKEVLSPVAKNFITKEWLVKIDPRLPKHIRDTRGHLFTADKPTLACNMKTIADQIPTMLAELDGASESSSTDTVNINYVPNRRGGAFPKSRGRGILRGFGSRRGYTNLVPRALPPPTRPQPNYGCQRCIEAIPARYDASKSHLTKDCPWPPNQTQSLQPKPNFRVVLIPENVEATEENYYDQPVFDSQFYDEATLEDVTNADDNLNKESYFYSCVSNSSPNLVKFQALPIRKVQTLSASINGQNEILTIDSGSEGNCIKYDTCQKLSLPVYPLDQDDRSVPTQADGKSALNIVGQTEFTATRGNVTLHFTGFVATTLSASILCGGPFIEENKIVQELHNNRIVIDGKHIFFEDSPFSPDNLSFSNISQNEDIMSLISIGSQVPKQIREKLNSIHIKHQLVFNGDLSGGYNGASGNFEVNFNFKGGIPPTPNYDTAPCYFSGQDRELLQAKIDELEAKGICVKVADTNIIPKYAAPCMLVKKHSARDLNPGEYEKMTTLEKLKYNRFILCHNKLSEHIEKQPAKVNTLDDTIRIVGMFEHVITTDLSDSFWQRHISKDKLAYFAFHSPYRGPYFFLRSTQGLINQSEGLEQLVSVILQDCISSGWCRVLADNLYVMGHSQEETVKHWRIVLELLAANNIKLSPKKTACFPDKLDLLGWTKEGKLLIPDPHRQNMISKAPLPANVKNLRSYLGAYRTFFRCKREMSFLLKDLEEFQAGKKSSDKLEWSEELKQKFFKSRQEILQLDNLYLPKQSDQLVMTSDWSEKGISCTLWAIVENKPKVVSRFSAKLEKSMENMLKASPIQPKTLPCDGEMMAVYVGIKSPVFSANIRSSDKKTVCLVDNKPVVEASKLLKEGKFSSSRVINNLMTALSEFNLEFQHHSAKMGQNKFDDFCSRNPASCNNDQSCKICSFIKDCQQLTIGGLSFSIGDNCVIGNVSSSTDLVQEILRGEKSIPFNNRNALKYLQEKDPDLIKLKDYLTTGKRPTAKQTNINKVKRYLQKSNKMTIAKDGCIIVTRRDQFLNNRELVVIPEDVSVGLIYAMHVNLNHPTAYQLSKILDTKFFILDKDSKVKEITKSCTLCCSISKIPREIETFKSNEMPQHPGHSFTVDILKMNKKNIIVTVENFSGFISTAFVKSEKSEDLLDAILVTTSPFRSSLTTTVRVDQAPGFRSLFKQKLSLADLNISLELGNAKNKNALALADKKIKELGDEIRKISSNGMIDLKVLTKATSVVNEKVRHQGLTAKEILFSRDQFSQTNLQLDDNAIVQDKMMKRVQGNAANAKSKAQVKTASKAANAKKGQVVFLKHEISKHLRREMYLVLDTDSSTDTLVIVKLPHALSGNKPISFQPHNFSYIVKQTDIILSPNQPITASFDVYNYDITDFDELDSSPIVIENSKSKPCYPYEDDENDEVETEITLVPHEDYSDNSTISDSASEFYSDRDGDTDDDDDADDERTGEMSSNTSTQRDVSVESIVTGNIDEADINDHEMGAAALLDAPVHIEPEINQSRQPRKGDLVSFVLDGNWVSARIIHKFKTPYYYNVELENGNQISVNLEPPTPDVIQSWTLISEEQLRHESFNVSREPSPIECFDRDSLQVTPLNTQMSLLPEQSIACGQVYYLPNSIIEIQAPNYPEIFNIDQKDYEKRYERILKTLQLPPSQRHLEEGMVNFLIHNELYIESQSLGSKFKKFFSKNKK